MKIGPADLSQLSGATRGAGRVTTPQPDEATSSPDAASSDFSEALTRAAAAAFVPEASAAQAIDSFARGAEGNIHETLLAVDKAEISFKFMVGVRNRLLEAYREIMRMGM